MFGGRHEPPEPPKYEPFLIILVAVAIAAVLTVGYFAFMALVHQANSPG